MGLSTALALLTCLATPVTGQDQPARQLHRPMEFVAGQDDNLFSLRRSQEDIYQWELGLTELEAGEHTAAVERLHRLLQNESGGVTPVAPGRFLGLRLAVIMTLANMSPAAKQAYDTLVQREAGHLADALDSHAPRKRLAHGALPPFSPRLSFFMAFIFSIPHSC